MCDVLLIRRKLLAAVGPIEDAALPDVLQQARVLQEHANKRGGGGSAAAQPAAAAARQQEAEFGAGLDFQPSRLYTSADEAVLAMCGGAAGSATPGQPRSVSRLPWLGI